MNTRAWIGLTLVMAAGAGDLSARQPVVARSVQQAVETTRAARALDIELALLEAQLATGGAATLAAGQAQLAMAGAELAAAMAVPYLDHQLAALEASLAGIGFSRSSGRSWSAQLDEIRPEMTLSLPQDPADSLWRAGRERLNGRDWQRAVDLFHRIRTEDRFRQSGYRAEAHYWEAFALAQMGRAEQLRQARDVLAELQRTYATSHPRIRDAEALATTIEGRLARTGDAAAAEEVYRRAEIEVSRAERAETVARSRSVSRSVVRGRNPQCPQDDEEDVRIAALSALLNVDSDRTVPVLREVMQRRDECSADLRRRALILLTRSRDDEAANVLIEAARNDPDESVREQAVLFLGGIRTPQATAALESMLRESNDLGVQRRALIALADQRGDEAHVLLRDYAGRENAPDELRTYAIMMLAGRRGRSAAEHAPFLRELYGRTGSTEVRTAILRTLARDDSPANLEWVLNVALDGNADADVRRQALFLAGHSEALPVERLIRLYDQVSGDEMKQQVMLNLARRSEPAAFDKLVVIARSESDVELRKKAIFWLGQSKDPRAPEVLLEFIR